jgi:hypothetical protein
VTEGFLARGVDAPDFYVAAIGRSGSTMLCNWLASPPDRLVFLEPFFLRKQNSRLLRIQLRDFGMPASDEEWTERDETAAERFERLMAPRLQGRRWAVKEVLCEEHFRALDALHPRKVLVTVRSIDDVALSFFEKHRVQDNLDRFSDDWVVRYCLEETAGILRLLRLLEDMKIPHRVVRYEDFTTSGSERSAVSSFVGWPGGGVTALHFDEFDRSFEVERHGRSISDKLRGSGERDLGYEQLRLAQSLAEQCADYQAAFDYYETAVKS